MEKVKHYFRNNAIVLNEKSKDYFTFLRQMPCFFLEHMLIIWQRFIKPLHSSDILIQRMSSFTNESHNLRWAIPFYGILTAVCLQLLFRIHINFHEIIHFAYSQLSLNFFLGSKWPNMVPTWRLNSFKSCEFVDKEQSTF